MPVEAKHRVDSWTIPLAEKLPSYNSNGIWPRPSCLVLKDEQLVLVELNLIYRSLGIQQGQVMIGWRTNNVRWNRMPSCMVMCCTDNERPCKNEILLPLLPCIFSNLLNMMQLLLKKRMSCPEEIFALGVLAIIGNLSTTIKWN